MIDTGVGHKKKKKKKKRVSSPHAHIKAVGVCQVPARWRHLHQALKQQENSCCTLNEHHFTNNWEEREIFQRDEMEILPTQNWLTSFI